MKRLDHCENDRIQRVFRKLGPEDERECDWRKCQEEPWRTFADVTVGA